MTSLTVYVDDMKTPYRGMLMCHMIADSREELLAMADQIRVARRWLQYPDTPKEHFDICQAKRVAAIKAGAVAIHRKELVAKIRAKRKGTL